MTDLNNVSITGNISTELELKKTPSGNSVCVFNVAVNRRKPQNENDPKADFFRVVAWRNTAEFVSQYLKKGQKIGVEGRLQTSNYQDRDTGRTVYRTEILAREVYSLTPKSSNSGTQPAKNGYDNTITESDLNIDDLFE